MAVKKPTMKAFREHLNEMYGIPGKDAKCFGPVHRSMINRHFNPQPGRYYIQRKRLYGDYLYFQDREQFDMLFNGWIADGCSKTYTGST